MSSIARFLCLLAFGVVSLGVPGCSSFPITGDVNFRSYPKESPSPKPAQPRGSRLDEDEATVARNDNQHD